MKHLSIRNCGVTETLIACALLAGCSSGSIASNPTAPAAGFDSTATAATLYAFSPSKPLVAAYTAGGQGSSKPLAVLQGSDTELAFGNGMAVDTDGTLYVIVEANDSSGTFMKLLVFAPGAQGNAAPERTMRLDGALIPGNATGLALDRHGNFWISAIGKLLRYPASATGHARPNYSIKLQLDTPRGYMAANSSNVALDRAGNVYCSCVVVFQGSQTIGVSEYSVTGRRPKLVRSFYDGNLPEVPPSTIAIDRRGTVYLASPLPNTGVFAYGPKTKSGPVHYNRRFTYGSGTQVISIAADSSGRVYVATGSEIMVFGPAANGFVPPVRTIEDPTDLDYSENDYGTLLSLR